MAAARPLRAELDGGIEAVDYYLSNQKHEGASIGSAEPLSTSTGGSGFIGLATVNALLSAGANVTAWSSVLPPFLINASKFSSLACDISSENALAKAFSLASEKFGPITCCIALASLDHSVLPHHERTFLTARTLRQLREHAKIDKDGELKNMSLIIRRNADYASGKSAVQGGLLRSLMEDVARTWPGVRVSAVTPGPDYTPQLKKEYAENLDQLYLDTQAAVALKRPVPLESVAKSILFLASENWSGSITGQILNVDSGKQGKVMWMQKEC
ncbi:NAD(P)-binding protein [Acephala macrosclerotiorum]|nr:NAD(P)-binding protein [Acephala macrosclerotiorum]